MLHMMLDGKPWFAAKRYGLGSGWPLCWQGWALLASHIALIAGLATALAPDSTMAIITLIVATIAPMPIYAAKTEGGWRWRWGA